MTGQPGVWKLLTYRDWTTAIPYPTDSVSVRNLSTTVNAGLDVWSRKKPQPAFVTVKLYLAQQIDSAAKADEVNNSTVHYGHLSKNILSRVENHSKQWASTWTLALLIGNACLNTAGSHELLTGMEVEVFYPKSSMLGDGVGFTYCKAFPGGDQARKIYLKDIRVPCIIGVNSNERELKQLVVANVWIECLGTEEACDAYPKAESIVTKTIEESSFETLESLAVRVSDQLMKDFVETLSPESPITIRVEKPVAVPMADAPAIEITRFPKRSEA